MPPLRMTRYVAANEKSWAGRAPPLLCGDFYVCNRREFFPHQSPAVTGFPQRGKPPVRSGVMSRGGAVHQERCFFRKFFVESPTQTGECVL